MKRRRFGKLLGNGVVLIGLALFVVWTLSPIIWMIVSSFTRQRALITRPPNVGTATLTWGNYAKVLDEPDALIDAFINSTIIAFFTTSLAVILGSAAAYALARLSVPGGNRIALVVLATQMFPGIVIIIPLFMVMTRLGLIDTHLGLILVYLSFVLPVVIWVLKGFFETIPRDLERAAHVDGASSFQIFRLVVLPISLPPLFAVAVFAFIESWNEFLFAIIMTRLNTKTVPIVISEFQGNYQTLFGQMLAAATLASFPIVVFAVLFRKYILLGFAEGAVKG